MAAADCIEDDDDLTNYAHFGEHAPVERERGRLQNAEAVLECMIFAMYEAEGRDLEAHEAPYFPSVAEVARNMLHEAISRLDSVSLKEARKKMKQMKQERAASGEEEENDDDPPAEGEAEDDADAALGDHEDED